ncbi:hypothetical protein ICE98_01152 [Lactococcus lactis]|nr:hypothetical protein [Lactococcus lactis]
MNFVRRFSPLAIIIIMVIVYNIIETIVLSMLQQHVGQSWFIC